MRVIRAGSLPLALALTASVAACAAGPGPRPGGGPGPASAPALFVSPFGEPFPGEPGQPWPSADWLLGADENLDGAVDFEEFAVDGRRWFGRLDQSGDGRLDPTELAAYEASLRGLGGLGRPLADRSRGGSPHRDRAAMAPASGVAPQAHGGGRGRPPTSGRHRPGGYGLVAEAGFFNLPQPVKAADVNVDQKVTAEEWARATERWFLALDADRDGRLTLASLPKTPLQRRAEARR